VEYSECKTVTVCPSRSIARKQLVETEYPGVCATVNSNWCKSETELYYLCVSVITTECITNC
jgi:hypothetical protein